MVQRDVSAFAALYRIVSGAIGGMLVAAIALSYYTPAQPIDSLELGMLLGSIIGLVSTLGGGK